MLSEKFIQAVSIANVFHKGHVRKGTQIPYISHLMAVASLVMESGGSEDEIIAALLHDAVEDGGGKPVLDKIKERFGQNIVSVMGEVIQQSGGWAFRENFDCQIINYFNVDK